MDQLSWYRRLFPRAPEPASTAIRAKADQGDVEAQFALGLKYSIGDGELQDLVRSAEWYRKASEQNHPLAQFNLALMCAKGEGVPQDDAQAFMWMRKAAHQGDAGAQFNLGMRY